MHSTRSKKAATVVVEKPYSFLYPHSSPLKYAPPMHACFKSSSADLPKNMLTKLIGNHGPYVARSTVWMFFYRRGEH